ncbi:hypothetical protein RN629_14845 [Sphingomonadaceae bacterium jetA1]|uniref:2-keto-4-pentenoate hydratase n=1 Tax=Facivitalis istanbulensis TaxID=3075838 RepID=UPI003497456C
MAFPPSPLSELARAIAEARATNQTIPPPPAALTMDEAYAVQSESLRLREAAVAGYKIGLTNPAAQRSMGTTEPILGRLCAADILHGMATIPAGAQPRFAEAELVVEMGTDLSHSGAPIDEARVAAAIGGVYAGIELCTSRYAVDDIDIGALIADNGHAEWLVVGGRLSHGWDDRFATMEACLLRDNAPPVVGNSASVLGNPLAAVTWLANWLATRGEALRRGQLVATGSCTGITEIGRHDRITSRFAHGMEAHARIGTPTIKREREG